MNRKKSLFFIPTIVFWSIVLSLYLVGCDSQRSSSSTKEELTDSSGASQEMNAQAKRASTSSTYLRLPLNGSISTLDPGLTIDTSSIELVEQLFLGLTDFHPETYEAIPELATHWDVSESGTVYRFYLREDVFWTDGKPVTAHDIVWAIRRNLSPRVNSPSIFMLFILKNAEAIHKGKLKDLSKLGVRAISDTVIEFELENPAAYFPSIAGLWVYRPLPRDTIRQFKEGWTLPENIVTNGSYLLGKWSRGTSIILKKNFNYFDADSVSINEVRYYVVNENSIGMTMYENNDLDIIGGSYLRLPLRDIPRIKSDHVLSAQFVIEPQFCNYYYGFNTNLPPVDNPLVRRAISAAIDRQLIIDVIVKDREPAHTFTRPPVFGSLGPEDGVGIQFNPEQARIWLAEAGYPDGEGFPTITLLHNFSEFHAEVASAVQTLLKHYLNIEVEIEQLEWDAFSESIEQPGTPHMYRYGWCSDYPDANNWLHELFHPTQSPNRIGWDNEAFRETVEQAQRISDQGERKALYKRAEQILVEEEAAVAPLYFDTAPYLINKRLKGWYNMALGGQHIRNWSISE